MDVNDVRIQAHRGADGRWTIRCTALVNGEYRSHVSDVPANALAMGAYQAVAWIESMYRDKEPS